MGERAFKQLVAAALIALVSGCSRPAHVADNVSEQQNVAEANAIAPAPAAATPVSNEVAAAHQPFEPGDDVYAACVLAPFPTGGLVKTSDTRVGDFVATIAGNETPSWEPNGDGAFIVRIVRADKLTGSSTYVAVSMRRTATAPIEGGACGPGALVIDGVTRDGQRAGGMMLYSAVRQMAQQAQHNRDNGVFPPVNFDDSPAPASSGPYTEKVLSEQEASNRGVAGEMGLAR